MFESVSVVANNCQEDDWTKDQPTTEITTARVLTNMQGAVTALCNKCRETIMGVRRWVDIPVEHEVILEAPSKQTFPIQEHSEGKRKWKRRNGGNHEHRVQVRWAIGTCPSLCFEFAPSQREMITVLEYHGLAYLLADL